MAWIDTDYVDNFIGQTQREKLFSDQAGAFDQDVFNQLELAACGTVAAVMQYAGYPVPVTLEAGTITTGFLSKLVAAVMVRDAYSTRRGIQLPQAVSDSLTDTVGMLNGIHAKRLPIPGMEPAAKDGYGGVQFSPTTGAGARPGVFTALRGTGF